MIGRGRGLPVGSTWLDGLTPGDAYVAFGMIAIRPYPGHGSHAGRAHRGAGRGAEGSIPPGPGIRTGAGL